MQLEPYLTDVADDLARATSLADEQTREVAARVATALEPALRQALTHALSDAAAALTAELDDAVVTCRMDGREPVLEVRRLPEHATGSASERSAASPETETDRPEEQIARVTLRLPEPVKQRAERQATQVGQSLKTWMVQAIRRATESARPTDTSHRTSDSGPRRVTGWA